MRSRNLSRRDVLKTSAGAAVGTIFPAPLKAAAPEATAVNPDLITAARKEGAVALTAMESRSRRPSPRRSKPVPRHGGETVGSLLPAYWQGREIRSMKWMSSAPTQICPLKRGCRTHLPEDVAKSLPSEQMIGAPMYRLRPAQPHRLQYQFIARDA